MILFDLEFTPLHARQKENVEKELEAYIHAYMELNQFSGSILISQKGQVIMKKGFGMANYEYDTPNRSITKFRIASLTKQFTAMAIMLLEEKGLLSIDDYLSKYIPDYQNGHNIKILHLLTHTSGIPDHTEFEDFNQERRVFHYEIDQTIETFKQKSLEFSPGEKFKYSNSGYILLGYIIEKVTQMTYEDFIVRNIFSPLKMNHSGFENMDKVIKDRAYGHHMKDDEIIHAKFRDISNAHASGALYSTVEDLYLWDRALYTDKLIGYESLKRMFTPFTDHYGYGWGIVDVFNRKMVGHNGETEGFRTNMTRFPNEDVCIIVLSNFEHAPIGKMSIDMAAILFGEKYTIPKVRQRVEIDPRILDDYVGQYELSPKFFITITKENERIFCQPTGQGKLEIHPESEMQFFLKEVDAQISFIRDEKGKVEQLILHQGGRDIPGKKIDITNRIE